MNKRALVLSVGLVSFLACTTLLSLLEGGYSFITAQNHFAQDTDLVDQALNARVYDANAVAGAAVFYLHSGVRERDDFRVLSESILSRYPYVQEIAFFPRVRPEERTRFEQNRREEGFAAFTIRDWQSGNRLPPQISGRSYYPTTLLEPLTPRSARLLGRDAATVPCVAAAIDKAFAGGRSVLLDSCQLAFAEQGIWLLRPVYTGRSLPGDPEDFAERARGILALEISPQALFAGIQLPGGLRYRVTGPGGRVLFRQGSDAAGRSVSTLAQRTALPLGGDRLFIDMERPIRLAELLRFGGGFGALMGLFFSLLSGLLASNLWERRRAQEALQRHRDHLEEEVALRTQELYETNRALEAEIAERQRVELELAQLAIRDPLTGLYNRREMDRRLDEEIERCRRYQHSLTVLMLDIDHFKRLNDTYGHQLGDEVLREVAERINRVLRRADFVARYGGEEFLAILPDTSLEQGIELAQRICRTIADTPAAAVNGEAIHVTASLGVSAFPPHGGNRESLCRHADSALYKAKSKGRNRVQAYSPSAVKPGAAQE